MHQQLSLNPITMDRPLHFGEK